MYQLDYVRLDSRAKAPVVANMGEDLGYDFFALEDTVISPGEVVRVKTGVAATAFAFEGNFTRRKLGMVAKDRSSMALKGVFTHGGVIDAGWTGEICFLMSVDEAANPAGYMVKAGDKVAQLVPVEVMTGWVREVETLEKSARGEDGFGSTGR